MKTRNSGIFFSIMCKIICVASFDIQSKGRFGLKFERMDCMCKEEGEVAMQVKMTNIQIKNSIFSCNMVIEITKEMVEPMKYIIEIEKCRSRESLDTCEKFYTYESKQVCRMLEGKGGWKTVYTDLEPRITCPIQKGTYVAQNSTFDLRGLPLLPVNGLYWKFHSQITNTDTGEVYNCCFIETPGIFKTSKS